MRATQAWMCSWLQCVRVGDPWCVGVGGVRALLVPAGISVSAHVLASDGFADLAVLVGKKQQ